MRAHPVLVGALFVALLAGCDESPVRDPDPESGTPVLLVVNSLGETLDRIDLETGTVQSNAARLGSAPNDVLIDPADGSVYIANSLSNTVTRLDGTTLALTKTFELGPDSNPYQLALLPDRDVAATNFVADDVAWLDRQSGEVIQRQPIGRAPQSILSHANRLYVGVTNYQSGEYGPGEFVVVGGGRVTVGTNPQDIVAGPDGNLHVICTGNYIKGSAPTGVWIVDPVTLAVIDTVVIGGTPAAAAVAGPYVYITPIYGGLMKYHGITHELLRGPDKPLLALDGLGAMVVDESSNRLYITGFPDDLIYVFDTMADTLVTAYSVGDGPVALARGTIQ